MSIFSRDMHLPSADQEWHIPPRAAFPIPEDELLRELPLEEHDTSYLAASERIASLSMISIHITS
jgi:hypothetical protein